MNVMGMKFPYHPMKFPLPSPLNDFAVSTNLLTVVQNFNVTKLL